MVHLYGNSQMILDKQQEINTIEITKEQVMKAKRHLKSNKAPGLDGITLEPIRIGSEVIEDGIVNLIQTIYNGEENPEEWLETQFILIA